MFGMVDELPQALYDSLRNEAVEKAKDADYVIYVGGLNKTILRTVKVVTVKIISFLSVRTVLLQNCLLPTAIPYW